MKKFIWFLVFVSWSLVVAPQAEAVLARGLTAAGVTINNTQGFAAQEYPNIIADGSGNTIVAWHDYKSGSAALYAQKFNSSGVAQWSPAAGVPICTVTNFFGTMVALDSNALAFQMVSDGSGGAIISWNDYRTDGTTVHIYAQRINSSGVVQFAANGKLVCDAAVGQNLTSMILDGSGGAILAWEDLRNMVNGSDIYVQRIDSSGAGQWGTNGLKITDNTVLGVGSSRPQLCSNGGGGAFVTWDDNRANASYAGVYAQKINANGSAAWAANGVAVQVNAAANAYKPKIVEDGGTGAIIAWWDERNNPGAAQYDVFTQRMDTNGDKVWTTQGVTLCLQSDYSDNSVDLAIVSDGSNGAIVSWPDMRNVGGGYRVYAQRVVANGGPNWTADGVAVNTVLNNTTDSRPRIEADGSGGCYIATANTEGVGSTQDIRVHRLNSSGAVVAGWTDGKEVGANTTNNQINPRIAYDSTNGQVVVVWEEVKNDSRGDIWGQGLTSGGAYGWGTTTGKELMATTGAATQRYPVVASDGAGGGVVVWEDARSVDYYYIYSQRFNSAGSVLWAADGVRLDNTAQDNLRPSICKTSDGYYIVAWTSGTTIYMQKLNSDGTAQWAAGGVAVASTFGSGFYYPVVASDGAGGAIVAYSVGASGAVTKTSSRFTGKLWASAYLSDISDGDLLDLDGLLLAAGGGPGGGGPGTFRLYYKRIDSTGAVVTPYGGDVQNATSLGVLATTYHDAVNGEIQLWPTIAKVDSTKVMIAWDDRRTTDGTAAWSIYAQSVNISDGTRNFTDNAQVVTAPGGTVVTYYPGIGSNGTDGTAVVSWMQSATGTAGYNYSIRANKLSSAGSLSWSTGINVANDASLDEIRPKVTVDSSGDSFFVWQEGTWSYTSINASTQHPDTPTMSNGAIYSQLVDSAGALSGTKFQVSGATNANYESPDVTATNTAGTDIVVWDTDITAQSVTGVTTVVAPVTVTPTAPTGFSGAAQSSSSILWSWTDNANNETGYRLINSQTNSIVATVATANTTSYSETGLSPNTAYRRTVAAYADANSTTPTAVTVYTLASIPDEMAATAAETSLAITWAVGDGTTYKIERAAASTGRWTTLSSTLTSKSYSDTGLTAGTTYWYRCSSANADGVFSAASTTYSFTTTTSGVTRQSPTIGGTKASGTGFAITSNDYMSSTGDLKLNVSDLNTDGRITSVVVQVFDSAGVEVRKVESSEVLASYSVAALPTGTYRVLITATSVYGTTSVKELTGLKVSDKLQVISAMTAYPTMLWRNSIRAQGVSAMQVAYQLSKNGNVSMVIYSTAGQVIYRGDYTPGANGGSAGPNAVSWDGYTVTGAPVGRGLYVVQLIDRDSKQLLGKVVIPVQN
ncbi:MAG: fibronectin type III domain-containing protein [Candidatus Margulisiibacteriota bacterium]